MASFGLEIKPVSINNDGTIVAIGAYENDSYGYNSGQVRVYEYDGSWTQIGQDIDGEAAGDQSGWSVSLSSDGNTVAIGATNNDGNVAVTLQANTTAGQSIMLYEGSGADGATYGHGLGAKPHMVIIKNRCSNFS